MECMQHTAFAICVPVPFRFLAGTTTVRLRRTTTCSTPKSISIKLNNRKTFYKSNRRQQHIQICIECYAAVAVCRVMSSNDDACSWVLHTISSSQVDSHVYVTAQTIKPKFISFSMIHETTASPKFRAHNSSGISTARIPAAFRNLCSFNPIQ